MTVTQVATNTVTGGGTSTPISLASFSGSSVVIVVAASVAQNFGTFSLSATWKGIPMNVAVHAQTDQVGVADQFSAWIAYLAIGTVAGESGSVVVSAVGGGSTGNIITVSAVEGVDQAVPLNSTAQDVQGSLVSSESLSVNSNVGDLLYGCLAFNVTNSGPDSTPTSGQTKQGGLESVTGPFMSGVNGIHVAPSTPSSPMNWSNLDGTNLIYALASFNSGVTFGPPVISNVNGGSVVGIDDTNLTINGVDLFSAGVSAIYLADGSNFGTATLVTQVISAITAPTINWDAINPGSLTIGPLFLFAVTDEGGGNEQVSVAFALTITEPTSPVITLVNGESQPADVFFVGTNIPVVGTDFAPAGTTTLTLADGSDFGTATKVAQPNISAIGATSLNWDSVTQGTLNPGLLYLYVTTQFGDPEERTSPGFALILYDVLQPIIVAVNGGSTVNEDDLNLTVTGQFFKRPGTEAFYLADGANFGAAVKVLQAVTLLDFAVFNWPVIVLGAIGTGAQYLFYVTDEGGPNEQISPAFALLIIPSTGVQRIEQIGDGTGMVLAPVIDSDPESDINVLVIRDHACWTGVGKWFYGRDFEQWPEANGDIVLKSLPGPWVESRSVRVNTVAVSDADRLLATELLTLASGSARRHFTVGLWIHKLDLVNSDIDYCSLYQLEQGGLGEYVELFVTTQAGDLHLGVAYDDGVTRHLMIHTERFVDATEELAGWVHVVADFSTQSPYLRLVQGNNEETAAPGSGPATGVYEFSFILHDFALLGGPSTPNIFFRFSSLWYGFGSVALPDIASLGASLTRIQYELTLQTVMSAFAQSDGPIHYYRCNDITPDRFIHNHAIAFDPGRAVGGIIQRDLDVPPFGVAKRIFLGCVMKCPVVQTANFNDWGASMIGHMRFLGDTLGTGVFLRLLHSSTGASIELSKVSPGVFPTELNGRLRFRALDATATPVVDFIWENPSFDPFDGTFLAFGVTTGPLGTDWRLSVGTNGSWSSTSMGVDNPPPWHGQSYDLFEFGGLDSDVHSFGFLDLPNDDVHDMWYAAWSTVLELLEFAEDRNFTSFYWCQNDVVND